MDTEQRIKEIMDEYIRKYAKDHDCTPEEAKNHIMVKIVEKYYRDNPPKDNDSEKLPKTELDIGCKGGC